jgi:mono/diheme cytochrome c family protein
MIAALAGPASVASAAPGAQPKGDVVAGKKLFKSSCGPCHTFKVAGTVARAKGRGPSFDSRRESFTRVFRVLVEGQGDMLPFSDRLAFQQLRDVAAFLADATKSNPLATY